MSQSVDITVHARTAYMGLLGAKNGRGYLLNRPPCPSNDPVGQGIELNYSKDVPIMSAHPASGCISITGQTTGKK